MRITAADLLAPSRVSVAMAPTTARAYGADWKRFTAWARQHGCPPEHATSRQIVEYIAFMLTEGASLSTVHRRRAGIRSAYEARGVQSPTIGPLVDTAIAKAKEILGARRLDKKPPLTPEAVVAVVSRITGHRLIDFRDRALILFACQSGMRRSELCSLCVEDIEFVDGEGAYVTIRRSKSDQAGVGATILVPGSETAVACPVRAMRDWLAASGIRTGAIFRAMGRGGRVLPAVHDPLYGRERGMSGGAFAEMLKARAAAIGIDGVSTHSLRSGFTAAAFERGASLTSIAEHARHKSLDSVAREIRQPRRQRASSKIKIL